MLITYSKIPFASSDEPLPLPIEIWVPMKKVRTMSVKSEKMVTKKVVYKEGAVYVRGALDNDMIELLEGTYYFQAWRHKLVWGFPFVEVRR